MVRIVAVSDVESAYDDPTLIGRLAGTIRAASDDRTLVIDAGDSTALGALAFATDAGREQARPFFERVSADVHVPGNHDFDPGPEWLAEFAAETPGRWLAANARTEESSAVEFEAVHTAEVAGETVAVIGVAHPETAQLTSTGSVAFTDPVPVVRRLAGDLDADSLVVASHGGRHDRRIAQETSVELVVGGHSHEPIAETVAGTPLVRTDAGGETVAVAELGDSPTVERRSVTRGPTDEAVRATYRERQESAGLAEPVTTVGELSAQRVARRVAGAYRRAGDADAGVVTVASVRRGLAGQLTEGDLLGVVPFGSTLQTLRVPGDDLRDALAVSAEGPLDDTHGRAVWDGAQPEAGTVGGEPIDSNASYRVAMMSYTAGAGLLPGVTPERVVADHGPQHEAWLDDVRAYGVERSVQLGDRE